LNQGMDFYLTDLADSAHYPGPTTPFQSVKHLSPSISAVRGEIAVRSVVASEN